MAAAAVRPETDRWQTLERLFHDAVGRPAAERDNFLDSACGSDAELRAEIQRLLSADAVAYDRIERIVAGSAASATDDLREKPGVTIGPYRLIRALGHGGMGSVWLAQTAGEDEGSRVALKLIRPELTNPWITRRFLAEQQILARLVHVNIARLVSGGTTSDGRPYFVMEFIEGDPIDAWCCDRGLFIEARIALFLDVCAAVQFSHANQVIHRDIKPGNILVTVNGTPKLLDFGIAKILGPGAAEALQTAPGVRLMTPHYASPEQVQGSPVSPATDVYSLGVVLYELLTERLPYRLESRQPLELSNAILTQQPEAPSAVVQNESLRQRLAGTLDRIVLTALQKEPAQRHASVEQFASELRQ